MNFIACEQAVARIESCPELASARLIELRELIQEVAKSTPIVNELAESLKWGQPSYVSNCGTPIRIDWSSKKPEKIGVYVNCQTSLVETYRELFGSALNFVGNREIELNLQEELPKDMLSKCIALALSYQHVKKLPLLGC